MKKIAFSLALLPLMFTLPQLPSQGQEQCIDSNCQVRFDYTGDWQEWVVPNGAKNISIQILGAQGGKSGGRGGELKATLTQPSPAKLFVFVGGAGSSGALAPGGFNGGGQAGSAHGDEGSGGGATDIRTSLLVEDRILVAGGGGGTGGWSGGQGGNGGGLIGQDGNAGQGGSGRGGSQNSGGTPGSSNGGYIGSAGGFGFGGYGGISSSAGGGGGGGGYFGGGGGGADVDSCCSDGGGGGGGSSWAYPSAIDVVHTQGVNQGNGYAIISFQLDYLITSSSMSQTGPDSFELKVRFNRTIELAATDFLVAEGCQLELSSPDQLGWSLKVSACPHVAAEVQLIDSTGNLGTKLPFLPKLFSLEMDVIGPEILQHAYLAKTSHPDSVLKFEVSEMVAVIPETQFEILGCESLGVMPTINAYELVVGSCSEGEVAIRLPAYTLRDSFGNLGPNTDTYWRWIVDTSGPIVSFTASDPGAQAPFGFSLRVLGDGVELNDLTPFQLELGTTECNVTQDLGRLIFENCQEGEISYTVPALSVSDELGNLGPEFDAVLKVQLSSEQIVNTQPTVVEGPTTLIPDPVQPSLESPVEFYPVDEVIPEEEPSPEPIPILENLVPKTLELADEVASEPQISAEQANSTQDLAKQSDQKVGQEEPNSLNPTTSQPQTSTAEYQITPVAVQEAPKLETKPALIQTPSVLIILATLIMSALGVLVWRFSGR